MQLTFSYITILAQIFIVFNLHNNDALICPVPPPCNCTHYSSSRAFCRGLNLTEIPKLNKTGGTWTIDFSNNKIRTIDAHAFKNVQLEQVYFSNNSIDYVDEQAFSGSEKTMDNLRLDGNQLKTIPRVVTRLKSLIALDIQYNPITNLDEEILTNMSKSFVGISFGSSSMTTWPTSLRRLKNLLMLSIYALPFNKFPSNAFMGFENTLGYLEVISTNFSNIPVSLNRLINLNTLTVKGNNLLTEITEEAFRGLANITTMIFENNAFTKIPAIYKDIEKVYQVQMSSNYLTEITKSSYQVKPQPKFYYLTITNTKLQRVPTALNDINVTVLSLSNGMINSIYAEDFQKLPSVVNIVLSSNPINNIETDAFTNLPSLRYLNLDGTRLTTVPEAIGNTNVTWVNMNSTHVQCTCSNLRWMKTWRNRLTTNIQGICANIQMTIQDFGRNIIPTC